MVTETKDRFVNTKSKIENDDVKRQPQAQKPRGIMKQAAEDLAQGLVDTDARVTPGLSEAVEPAPDATGQAKPLPDRGQSMRDHDSVIPSRGKNQ